MSIDEALLGFVCFFTATACWVRWFSLGLARPMLGRPQGARSFLHVIPVACVLLFALVFRSGADEDARADVRYTLLYFLLGGAWLGLCVQLFPYLGISARDDVLERDNRAAAYAVAGAMMASTVCFTGGNVGNGPGWPVVVFSAGLATGGLFLLWLALELSAGVAERVTVERDPAAGARLAGFLMAAALVLGRSVAGNWSSAEAAVRDLVLDSWPALLLVPLAATVERWEKPLSEVPTPSAAIRRFGLALGYVALAAAYVAWLGPPG